MELVHDVRWQLVLYIVVEVWGWHQRHTALYNTNWHLAVKQKQ